MYIEVNDYIELAIKDTKLRKEIRNVKEKIREVHNISHEQRYDKYLYEGSFDIHDISNMEQRFGFKFIEGDIVREKAYFKRDKEMKPKCPWFIAYYNLLDTLEDNAKGIMEIRSGSKYEHMKIGDKLYSVDLPLDENWGFKIRDNPIIGEDHQMGVDDIIKIEKLSNAKWYRTDLNGHLFKWDLSVPRSED